ncbi:MAG: polysaccharide biosynthesis C-terminal domain-containing protein [Bacteroidota bacterium]
MPSSLLQGLNRYINTVNAMQFFQLFRFGTAILISILLTKSSLTTAEIAVYEWLLFIGTALSFFWVNAFLEALLPLYPERDAEGQRVLFFQAFCWFGGMSLLLVGLLWGVQAWALPLLTGRSDLPFFHYYLLFLLFNLPTVLIEYIYLLRKQSQAILLYGALAFGGYLVAVLLPIFAGWGLEKSLQGMVLVGAAKLLWLLVLLLRYAKVKWEWEGFRAYLALGVPLVAYAMVGGFANIFDSWLVGWSFAEEEAFAVFRYGARELPLATALVGGLYTAMVPEVAVNLERAMGMIKEKSRRMYHWLFPVSILLMLSSDYLFPLIFNPDFAESATIFKVYLLALISRALLPYTLMMGLKQTRPILLISILEMLVNIGLSLWLVQVFGLPGIALATVIAYLFEKLAMIGWLKIKFGIAPSAYTDFGWYWGYGLLLLLSFFFGIK